jgi:transcriptional regulator with XRE-family HTH domain
MSEQQRGRRAIEAGPTGKTVADNLARLRKIRGLTTRQLSGQLERNGRHIPASGITRMEKAERQVTVDELVALAVVLGVSPASLLLPLEDSATASVEVTGGGTVSADTAWDWADGKRPLRWPEDVDAGTADLEYRLYGRPPGRRQAQSLVLQPRGARGREQMAKIRDAYRVLADQGLDLPELQRLDVEAFERLMGEVDDG